jgi:hypothetical protein
MKEVSRVSALPPFVPDVPFVHQDNDKAFVGNNLEKNQGAVVFMAPCSALELYRI